MVRLPRIGARPAVQAVGKCEFMNPGGSVKDRIGVRMLARRREERPHQAGRHADRADQRQHRHRPRDGRRRPRLPRDHHDAREDEPGEAGRARGARRRDHPHADRGRVGRAREPHRRRPPPAARSPELAHPRPVLATRRTRSRTRRAPAARSSMQCGGKLDAVVMTAGTGGTITGVATAIKREIPKLQGRRRRSRGLDPRRGPARSRPTRSRASATTSSPTCSIARSSTTGSRPNDRDSFLLARQLIRQEGLLVGGSSGAAVWAALQAAARLRPGRTAS